MADGYLIEVNNHKREHEAILRLFEMPFIYEQFFQAIGLNPLASWYLLEIREHHFDGYLPGEVDILAGPLTFESGKINLPESISYLIGIEVKCAYRLPGAQQISRKSIKSQKSSPSKTKQIQKKIERLLKAGLNKVLLLDIIANPPASGLNGQAWFNASDIAVSSIEALSTVLQKRLPDSTQAGHWIWSIGAVAGGNETIRNTGAPIQLREACNNLLIDKDIATQKQRKVIQKKLSVILSRTPLNCSFPSILIDCRICGKIHGLKDSCDHA